MIVTFQFSCAALGCRAHARADITVHDDHEIDVEKLGSALGFRRVDGPGIGIVVNPWQCFSHGEKEKTP